MFLNLVFLVFLHHEQKGFEKIFLPAGKTKTVNFNLTPEDYSFIGRNNTRIIEPGKFIISVDKLKQEFTIK